MLVPVRSVKVTIASKKGSKYVLLVARINNYKTSILRDNEVFIGS